MIRVYQQRISSCFGCPNLRRLEARDVAIDWCRKIGKKLEATNGEIPAWCPLPEAKPEPKVDGKEDKW